MESCLTTVTHDNVFSFFCMKRISVDRSNNGTMLPSCQLNETHVPYKNTVIACKDIPSKAFFLCT